MADPKEIKVEVMGETVTILDYGDGLFVSKAQGGGFDTPENRLRDIASAYAIELTALAHKRAPKVMANRKNAEKPRNRVMLDPTPEEVVATMKKLRIINSRGEKLVHAYIASLLAEMAKTFPAINESALKRRIASAKKMKLIKPA